jgi:hypothetical protein
MTTLAWDGVTLATDSLLSSSNINFGVVSKIVKLEDGRYLASAGDYSLIPDIVIWLNGGDKPEIIPDTVYMGVLITPDKQVFEISKELKIFPCCTPWAGGSGEVIALTAMLCGKTAEEAVKLACKLDLYSGLPVKKVTI